MNKKRNVYHFLNRYYLPWFALGIIVFSTYSIHTVLRNDLFEIANSGVAMMNIFQDGKLPVADFLSTHLLSDFFTPVIYTILNGYDSGFSYMAYEFILSSAYYFIGFLIIYKISGNKFLALTAIMFFPFFDSVFWSVSSFPILLTPFVLYRLYKKPVFKSWLLLFIFTLLLMAWKPDVAVIGIYGILAGICILLINKYREIRKRDVIISFSIVFGTFFILLIALEVIFNFPVKEGISNTLGFFASSPQARGLPVLTRNFDRFFHLHHIIYPIAIAAIGMAAFSKIRKLNSYNLFLVLTLVTFCIFYITNVQRGLTRHSFAEGVDGFISSFAVICIGLGVYLFRLKRIHKHLLFFGIISLMLIMLKFPDQAGAFSINGQLSDKLKGDYYNNQAEPIQRISLNEDFYNANVREFKSFAENLPDGESFFDFSNTPALYYITGKEFPVYFIHQLAVSKEKLQKIEINYLEKNNPEYVIHSHHPLNWYDKTDGIPNPVRFYQMSEYIYQNYEPYKIVGNYAVWKRMDVSGSAGKYYPNDTVSQIPRVFNMQQLPYFWANYDEKFSRYDMEKNRVCESSTNTMYLPETVDKSTGNYVLIELENTKNNQGVGKIQYFTGTVQHGEITFDIKGIEESEKYLVRISTQYNWFCHDITKIIIKTSNEQKVKNAVLLKAD